MLARLDEYLRRSSRRRSRRPAGTCTGRATRPRRTRSSRDVARAHGADRGREGEVADDRRDRPQRRARRRGHPRARDRLRGADPPARRRLVVAHPRPGDPPQPHRDPRPLRAHDRRPASRPTTRATSPRRRGSTCASASSRAQVGVSGANFGVAETGTVVRRRVGGQRPHVHDAAAGARHRARDREARCRASPTSRSSCSSCRAPSTGERMNPYTSLWTGVTAGDGPQELHVVLLDNGRTRVLARRGRPAGAALHPLQRLPQRLPGLLAHRRPRLRLGLPGPDRRDPDAAARSGIENAPSLPYASSLCGACYEVCPVKIDIPTVLLHLRGAGRARADGVAAGARRDARRRRGSSAAARRLRARAAARRGSRSGRSCAAASIRRLPGPLARLDARARPAAGRARRASASGGGGAAMSDARDEILARVRAALGGPRRPEPASRALPARRERSTGGARRALLRARSREYRAEVRRVDRRRRSAARSRRSAATRRPRLGVPPGLPGRVASRRASSSSRTTASTPAELDALDGVLTGCTVAIAETGTLVLAGGPARGPARADARPRPARLRRRGAADRRARARGDRAAPRPVVAAAAAADVRLRPVGDLGHRARPRRGRPRPAHARGAGHTRLTLSSCKGRVRFPAVCGTGEDGERNERLEQRNGSRGRSGIPSRGALLRRRRRVRRRDLVVPA